MRTTHILELSRRHVHQRRHCNQRSQNSHTFHTMKESLTTDTRRTPRSREMYAEGPGVCILARNKWWHLQSCGKMWHMPSKFQSSQALRECQQSSTTTSMARLRHWFVLLEQDQLPHDQWLLHQVHILQRLPNSSTHTVIKELRMVFTEFGQPFMLRRDNGLCYSSKEFQEFLSTVKCTTSWAAHIIHRVMALLRLLWASQEVDWKSHERQKTMELRIAAVSSYLNFQ